MQHLRTLTLAALAGGMIALTACSKDEDDFTRAELVGTWNVTGGEYSASFMAGGESGDEEIITIDSSSATWTFNDDGTYAVEGVARHTYVEYPGTDSAETEVYVAALNEVGTFTVEGMTVTTVETGGEDAETFAFAVKRFAAGELIELASRTEETEDFFGVEIGVAVNVGYVLEK